MTAAPITAPVEPGPRAPVRSAADLLHDARARERAACIPEAAALYEAAIAAAQPAGEHAALAEALRRFAVLRHRRGESAEARELCRRSHAVACHAGNAVLAGEALNTLGGVNLATDAVVDARQNFLRALELGGQSRELRALGDLVALPEVPLRFVERRAWLRDRLPQPRHGQRGPPAVRRSGAVLPAELRDRRARERPAPPGAVPGQPRGRAPRPGAL